LLTAIRQLYLANGERKLNGTDRRASVAWLLFGFDGRIARRSFILGQLFMLAIFAVVVTRIVAVKDNDSATIFWGFVFIAFIGVSIVSSFALVVKRLHDLSLPGALALILCVPTLNILFVIALMALPSKPEVNEHGPPPFGPVFGGQTGQNHSSTD
jgi:uncharacterized membrane protein YhaH (DUF805 family)